MYSNKTLSFLSFQSVHKWLIAIKFLSNEIELNFQSSFITQFELNEIFCFGAFIVVLFSFFAFSVYFFQCLDDCNCDCVIVCFQEQQLHLCVR